MLYQYTTTTPFGALYLVGNAEGICALYWRISDVPADISEVHENDENDAAYAVLHQAADALVAYFKGDASALAAIPVWFQTGTSFEQSAWEYLRTIPEGEMRTYKEQADALKSGPRAIGNANSKNPIPIIIPCHRVRQTDGSLGGYSGQGGIATKEALLRLEGAL